MTTPSTSFPRRRARIILVLVMMVVALVGGMAFSGAAPAQAAVPTGVPSFVTAKALTVAASRRGATYRAGGVGPTRFDCSGLTAWTYAKVGKRLPHSAAAQMAATIRISKAQARPGDLVFFMSGSRTYHVGVYAGHGRVWHAPKPGGRVSLVRIWTTAVRYGRVR